MTNLVRGNPERKNWRSPLGLGPSYMRGESEIAGIQIVVHTGTINGKIIVKGT
jgi:hypothetical protein